MSLFGLKGCIFRIVEGGMNWKKESVDAKNILSNQAHNVGLPGPGPSVRKMS